MVTRDGGAEVELDVVAELEGPVGGLGVRVGGVRAEGGDGIERQLVASVEEDLALDLQGCLLLADARLEPCGRRLEGSVGGGDGAAKDLDLLGILHHALCAEDLLHGHQLDAVEELGELVAGVDGHVVGLEGHPLDALLDEAIPHGLLEAAGADENLGSRRLTLGAQVVSAVGHNDQALVHDHPPLTGEARDPLGIGCG